MTWQLAYEGLAFPEGLRWRRVLLKVSGEVLMGEGGLTALMTRAVAAAKRRAGELAG